MSNPFYLLWKYRRVLLITARNDIYGRYAGSVFGKIWTLIYPLLFLSVYAIVFIAILKVKVGVMTTNEYILLIFCGIIPWLGFAEALGNGVTSVSGNPNLIKNTLFPIELAPVKAVLTSIVIQIIGLSLLTVLLGVAGKLTIAALFVPVTIVLQLIFSMGLIWLLSALNVFIKDLGQVTNIFILLLMMISPIGYTEDMIPKGLMPVMHFNPLYYLIALYREPMFNGSIPVDTLLIFSAVSFSLFFLGFYVFTKLKLIFSDFV